MQTFSINCILATRRGFFFTKVAPVQSITDIALLDFWLTPLFCMFIASYTAINLFREEIYFFLSVYISVNLIFECP